jgi:hypothetical protein
VIAVVLSSFTFNKRFVDDLLAAANTLLPCSTYCNQHLGPITGVDDSRLQLQPSVPVRPGLHSVPYLDLELLPSAASEGTLSLAIQLYDKRQSDTFNHLNISRFPHATSNLSTAAKVNIVTSRYVHFCRVITVQSDFCWQLARVMFDFARRGYRMPQLWAKLATLPAPPASPLGRSLVGAASSHPRRLPAYAPRGLGAASSASAAALMPQPVPGALGARSCLPPGWVGLFALVLSRPCSAGLGCVLVALPLLVAVPPAALAPAGFVLFLALSFGELFVRQF